MKESEVLIQIDLSKVNLNDVFKAERALAKIGITFDTGSGFGYRDWEWDYSLSGPIKVYHQRFKKKV